jgi:fructoselysine-6-phosphate deglycase
MIRFDDDLFLSRLHSAIEQRPAIEAVVDELVDRGIDSGFFVGSGGTYANAWPYVQLLHERSTIRAFAVIAADLVLTGHASLGPRSVVVVTSKSGTTEDVIAALDYVNAQGAHTVAFTNDADSPIASRAHTSIVSADGSWPFDVQHVLFTTRLLDRRGEFDTYAAFADELGSLPDALLALAQEQDATARAFAEAHRDTKYHFLSGSGPLWANTYIFSMCVLEEMQWLLTTRVEGAEFFHGSLELLEPDTSVFLLLGEDRTRPIMERVRDFSQRISRDVTVVDTATFALPGLSRDHRALVSPLAMSVVLQRFSSQLGDVRGHSLDLRRYYRVMEY